VSAFCASTNVLQVPGLTAEIQNEFVNDATVTVTIRDSAGVELAGASWPLVMNHVPGSNGKYRAFLSATLPLAPKTNYVATIDADGGRNRVGHFEFHFRPVAQEVTA
jgi:hypothetical protein